MSELPCEACGGTGFTIKSKDGREYAERCSCQSRAAAGAGSDPAARCRIPPRYEHCSLESFEPGNPSLSAALEKALAFCSGYPHLGADEGLGLLFCGDNGVGKTHLAVAVLRELVTTRGARGQFWDFHELIREIRHSYDEETRTTELQVLAPVVDTDVLLLDDLGAWKMTEWMLDTLFFILNSRYMAKRATLITTNFPDVAPEQAARDSTLRRREFLVERVGTRLRSRLVEMCLLVKMHGDDHPVGSSVFQRKLFVDPNSTGGLSLSEMPPALAPRNCGHVAAALSAVPQESEKMANEKARRRRAEAVICIPWVWPVARKKSSVKHCASGGSDLDPEPGTRERVFIRAG